MRRIVTSLILIVFSLSWTVPTARAYTLQYADKSSALRIKWPSSTIKIALSKSLNAPPSNIKEGSDVQGAVRRALARWSRASNITFIETSSDTVSISPSGNGDGISLITVADTPENRAAFDNADRTGRTRVFYDTAMGAITEADVVVNPAARFSTDGTLGTYDLETTFTHEIGHVLGLDHSSEAGSVMQPHQGINGLYEQAAVSARTLSDDDRAGVRALYGSPEGFGAITGKVGDITGSPAASTHVWAEEVQTGKVVAGNSTLPDGSYSLEGLPPGEYRLVAESENDHADVKGMASGLVPGTRLDDSATASHVAEIQTEIRVTAGANVHQDIPLDKKGLTLKPQLFGTNGHLSTIAVPLAQGKRYTIFVGGEGLDELHGDGITVTSPFIKVDPSSLTLQAGVNYNHPIISFDIEVSPAAPLGDYSIRLQSRTGEVAYISGGLTVDAANGVADADAEVDNDEAILCALGINDNLLDIFSASYNL
ncbi:MAG TPA: matrixin family metalloprotease [Pyrinomonadaceae bacterium]